MQTNIGCHHQKAQLGLDSQTDQPQAHNTASGCNTAPSHGRHTDFAGGRFYAGYGCFNY